VPIKKCAITFCAIRESIAHKQTNQIAHTIVVIQ